MQLSVIILNYNVRYFLELCVLSVQAALADIDSEIIVVDNNSTDDSCAMMKARFPAVTLLQNDENLGFPKGNNIAVAQAKGEYVCILNPDTVVAENTFIKVLEFARNKVNLGIVGVKLIDGSGNFLPESKRSVPTPFVAFTKVAGLYKIFPNSAQLGKYYAQHLTENQTGKVDILVGAFMLLKRDLYNSVGGFDEDCFMYSDDIDLSYRVLKEGKDNFYFHDTTLIHYKGESTVRDEVYMQRFQQAMDFFYKKHFKVPFLFTSFMKMGIVAFSFVKKLEGSTSRLENENDLPKTYHLFSSDKNVAQKMEIVLQKKIVFHDLKTEKMVISSTNNAYSEMVIVLDNQTISFKDIINCMEFSKKKGISFRIIPKNANFLIGSDDSKHRGEVVKFN